MSQAKANLKSLLLHMAGRPLEQTGPEEIVLVVSGSRGLKSRQVYPLVNQNPWCQSARWLYHGGAEGVDTWVAHYFREVRRLPDRQIIPYEVSPFDWKTQGLSAGPKRNRQMLEDACQKARATQSQVKCLAVWDGSSPGTKSVIDLAPRMGIETEAYVWESGRGFYRRHL